jgi:hypothetical protein
VVAAPSLWRRHGAEVYTTRGTRPQGQVGGAGALGDHVGGVALAAPAHADVERPPRQALAFGSERVVAEHPVQDRIVDVQLRVAVAARVLRERRDHPLVGVHETARSPAVVTGAAVPGLPLQVVEHGLVGSHDRVPHGLSALFPHGCLGGLADLARLLRLNLQRRVEQADRLRHRKRHIEEEHRRPPLAQRPHDQLIPALG